MFSGRALVPSKFPAYQGLNEKPDIFWSLLTLKPSEDHTLSGDVAEGMRNFLAGKMSEAQGKYELAYTQYEDASLHLRDADNLSYGVVLARLAIVSALGRADSYPKIWRRISDASDILKGSGSSAHAAAFMLFAGIYAFESGFTARARSYLADAAVFFDAAYRAIPLLETNAHFMLAGGDETKIQRALVEIDAFQRVGNSTFLMDAIQTIYNVHRTDWSQPEQHRWHSNRLQTVSDVMERLHNRSGAYLEAMGELYRKIDQSLDPGYMAWETRYRRGTAFYRSAKTTRDANKRLSLLTSAVNALCDFACNTTNRQKKTHARLVLMDALIMKAQILAKSGDSSSCKQMYSDILHALRTLDDLRQDDRAVYNRHYTTYRDEMIGFLNSACRSRIARTYALAALAKVHREDGRVLALSGDTLHAIRAFRRSIRVNEIINFAEGIRENIDSLLAIADEHSASHVSSSVFRAGFRASQTAAEAALRLKAHYRHFAKDGSTLREKSQPCDLYYQRHSLLVNCHLFIERVLSTYADYLRKASRPEDAIETGRQAVRYCTEALRFAQDANESNLMTERITTQMAVIARLTNQEGQSGSARAGGKACCSRGLALHAKRLDVPTETFPECDEAQDGVGLMATVPGMTPLSSLMGRLA